MADTDIVEKFDFSWLKNMNRFFKDDLPEKVQLEIYHLDGAPSTSATPLCIYDGKLMDRHTAICLNYLNHLDRGEYINVTAAVKLTEDDFGKKLFAASSRHIKMIALNINRMLGKVHCEIEISKPELVTMIYKMINEPVVEYVNAGYKVDKKNGGKIFEKRKLKKPLSVSEKRKLIELIAKLEGHIKSDGVRGLLTPPRNMDTEITFKFKKTPPPGAGEPVKAESEIIDG